MAIPVHKDASFTYGDYVEWTEGRFELIEGVVYDMSPAASVDHQRVSFALAREIDAFLDDADGECEVFVAPFDVRLPDDDEDDDAVPTVVQPDVVVVCDPEMIDDRGCRGAPDWVIEVLSPSTATKDQMAERLLYERHGVREYWLVHPGDRTLTVYRPDADGRYGAPDVTDAADTASTELFPGLEIDWSRVFDRVDAR
ncbi:MAG: Uma2 family endonuclease [Acidobacteriota bacterium]